MSSNTRKGEQHQQHANEFGGPGGGNIPAGVGSSSSPPSPPPPAPPANATASTGHHQDRAQDGGHGGASGSSCTHSTSATTSAAHFAAMANIDPEQLAKIVEAARATGTQGAIPDDADTANLYEQARHALANLPGNLGAASTLSEFAAGFKRSDGTSADDGTAGTSHHDDGSGLADDSTEDSSRLLQGGQGQSGRPQDTAATAAAIAAMGSLAGHQVEREEDGASPHEGDQQREDSAGDVSTSKSGRRAKSERPPENERQRKDSHKEVERKCRAGINAAINELQVLVPHTDVKNINKNEIILKAATYIRDLKTNEASNIEKWTLEKLLMDQAMNDLSAQLDASRREVAALRAHFGKEADEVPRSEEMVSWESTQHQHQQQQHQSQEQHQSRSQQQRDQSPNAFEQREDGAGGSGGSRHGEESTGGASGPLGDVAAAAAAAARAVAATTDSADSKNDADGGDHAKGSIEEAEEQGSHGHEEQGQGENEEHLGRDVEAARVAAAAAAVVAGAARGSEGEGQEAEEAEGAEQRSTKFLSSLSSSAATGRTPSKRGHQQLSDEQGKSTGAESTTSKRARS